MAAIARSLSESRSSPELSYGLPDFPINAVRHGQSSRVKCVERAAGGDEYAHHPCLLWVRCSTYVTSRLHTVLNAWICSNRWYLFVVHSNDSNVSLLIQKQLQSRRFRRCRRKTMVECADLWLMILRQSTEKLREEIRTSRCVGSFQMSMACCAYDM